LLFLIKCKEEGDGRKWLKRREVAQVIHPVTKTLKYRIYRQRRTEARVLREVKNYKENQYISCLDSFLIPINTLLDQARF